MLKNPLISIIMPVHNSERYLPEAISSVEEQTFQNWELLVIDDKSTDKSYTIAQSFAKKENRIFCIQNPANYGTAHSRNVGISLSKGNYVVFLDSDDFLDKTFLEEQLHFLLSTSCAVVTSGYRRISNNVTPFVPPRTITARSILCGNPISCLSTMYDKEKIGPVLFDESLEKCEDLFFWFEMLKNNGPAKGNSLILANYRIHPQSKSNKKLSLIKWQWIVYRKKIHCTLFVSLYFLFRWALYGLKKYKNVN